MEEIISISHATSESGIMIGGVGPSALRDRLIRVCCGKGSVSVDEGMEGVKDIP
jgi:hypothetical protein